MHTSSPVMAALWKAQPTGSKLFSSVWGRGGGGWRAGLDDARVQVGAYADGDADERLIECRVFW